MTLSLSICRSFMGGAMELAKGLDKRKVDIKPLQTDNYYKIWFLGDGRLKYFITFSSTGQPRPDQATSTPPLLLQSWKYSKYGWFGWHPTMGMACENIWSNFSSGKSSVSSGSGYLERPIWSLNLSGLLEIKGFIVIQFPLEVDTIRSTTQEGPSAALRKNKVVIQAFSCSDV